MTIAVQTAAKAPRMGTTLESDARAWIDDPLAYFGTSNTQVHSFPRRDAEAIQLAAMNMLLEQRRAQIPVLAKFADSQGINGLATLDDMAPLLFEHTVYKSYPVSLLAKQRYGQLNQWLDRLTPYDISGVDVSQCKSIEDWLVKLQTDTPLDVTCSSGTTGTMSFFPRSKRDYMTSIRNFRMQVLQKFGKEPTETELTGKYHLVTPGYRDGHNSAGRFAFYNREVLCHGDESFLHVAFNFKVSPDLMWLSARLRAAAAKGDATRVEVPEILLARRAELEKMNSELPAMRDALARKMTTELKGQRVLVLSLSSLLYELTVGGIAAGQRPEFAPGSVIMGSGGAKGTVLPEGWEKKCVEFFGADRMAMSYGMTEMNCFCLTCEHDRYHLGPWVTLFLLDLETGKPLPRTGVQTGRAAFFDPTHDGSWGGIISGDLLTVDYAPCPCGRTTLGIDPKIQRVSEAQGGDDKITCAATPAAQAEAMDYLTNLDI